MNILEQIVDFIFGFDQMHSLIERDFKESYEPNIKFDDLMKLYKNEN